MESSIELKNQVQQFIHEKFLIEFTCLRLMRIFRMHTKTHTFSKSINIRNFNQNVCRYYDKYFVALMKWRKSRKSNTKPG